MSQVLTRALQENILTLLCFSAEHSLMLSELVDASKFDGFYQTVAQKAIVYIDEFRVPPGDHLPELLEHELQADPKQTEHWTRLLLNLYESKDSVHAEYVISKLSKFINLQTLRGAIIEAAEQLQRGEEDAVENAEVVLQQAFASRVQTFSPGVKLTDPSALDFLLHEEPAMPTGIPFLDRLNLGPSRKELHLFMAMQGRGKTWWLINLGKHGLLHRQKVCHITLEFSERNIIKRYYQSLFAIAKRKQATQVTTFKTNSKGVFLDLHIEQRMPKHVFEQSTIFKKLHSRIKDWAPKLGNLVVKEFPTGGLTTRELTGYLDLLESSSRFVPDLLLVDYPDLMRIDSKNYRIDLGRVYKELRGIAVERNIAVGIVSQSNRAGSKVKKLTEANIGEDFSKIQTTDTAFFYNQTDQELKLGLARIEVAKTRNEAGHFEVLISQNYNTGQFCLDSSMVDRQYQQNMKKREPEDDQ
jgi:hypothetical protein